MSPLKQKISGVLRDLGVSPTKDDLAAKLTQAEQRLAEQNRKLAEQNRKLAELRAGGTGA